MENDLKGNENWLELAGGLRSQELTFMSCVTPGARSKEKHLVCRTLISSDTALSLFKWIS